MALEAIKQIVTEERAFRSGKEETRHFLYCQWPIRNIFFVVYRVIASLYFLAWIPVEISYGGGFKKVLDAANSSSAESAALSGDLATLQPPLYHNAWWYILFLTNWTFMTFNSYLLFSAIHAFSNYWSLRNYPEKQYFDRHPQQKPTVACIIQWILFNLSLAMNITVVLGFWTLLVPFEEKIRNDLNPSSIHVHLINGIFILADLMIVAMPIRLLHVVFGITFGIVYVSFSAIYWASGGLPYPIYGFLDYENSPGSTAGIVIALGFVVIPLIWTAVYGLYRLRCRLYSERYTGEKQHMSLDNPGFVLEPVKHNKEGLI